MGLGPGAIEKPRHGRRGLALLAVASFVLRAAPALGQTEPGGAAFGQPLQVHGFVSQGFILSTKNEYLAHSKSGSVEFSEVGLNFTKSLTEELRVGLQLFAHDLGPIGNYDPQVDWFYLDYRPVDWLGIRLGRTKVPFGLFNEVNDIDVARVPILLPQSIYQVDHREFLFAQTGGELYGDLRLAEAGALEYRAYGGTLLANLPGASPPGITVASVRVPYLYGGRLLWSTPLQGLLAGGSGQAVRFDTEYNLDPAVRAALEGAGVLPPGLVNPLSVKFRVTRWIASLQYAAHDLELSAEYSRWIGQFYSRAPAIFPQRVENERYYVMASYRVNDWFTPGAYYSAHFDNVEQRHRRGGFQHDVAVTARYDLNAHWLLKLEGHVIHGTAALDNAALNDGIDRAQLPPTWGLFLAKTTAYF